MVGKEDITNQIKSMYSEIITWSKNLFMLPKGKVGKDFVHELTRIINHFVEKSEWQDLSLPAAHIFVPLMLQKPSVNSKASVNSKYLKERLALWDEGNLGKLRLQATEIQKRIQKELAKKQSNSHKLFCRYMMHGILQVLQEKHPEAAPLHPDIPLQYTEEIATVEPVIFEAIDETSIYNAAKNTFGSAGPTHIDSDGWKHILCSKFYGKKAEQLRTTIAGMCRRICTEEVNPDCLEELLSCRLIPLKKKDDPKGVRPIGIGEVLRRIMGKAVMSVIRPDIMEACGSLQTCSGIESGIEAAVHSMATQFKNEKTQAMLLVDASNAFNSLNRQAALLAIKHRCPPFYRYLQNTYQATTRQYISGSKEGRFIPAREGATQGDNAAMAFYGISTTPIIEELDRLCEAIQAWYADDSSSCGSLDQLLHWWKTLCEIGPKYGYHPNAKKTILIVKNIADLPCAKMMFKPHGVNVSWSGERHLGAVIGTEEFRQEYVSTKVQQWVDSVQELSTIAVNEPQLAYSSYVKGLSHKWTYLQRTIPGVAELFQPLEDAIRASLLPALLGKPINDTERQILALPVRIKVVWEYLTQRQQLIENTGVLQP